MTRLMRFRAGRLAEAFRRDRRGSIAMTATAGILAATLCAGFMIDMGTVHVARRKAQTAADLAAIAAAAQIDDARAVAARTVLDNGVAEAESLVVTLGTYSADPALDLARRFRPDLPGPNAARVEMQTTARLAFGRFASGQSTVPIRVQATAMASRSAALVIGSRLARIDEGLLNGLTSALLGTSIRLDAMDYEALLDSRVSLFGFARALATQIDLRGGTYGDVFAARASVGDTARALQALLDATPGSSARASGALRRLGQDTDVPTLEMPLSRLIDAGPYGVVSRVEVPAYDVDVSAFDLLMAHAQTANAGRLLDTGAILSVPGVASLRARLFIGERPHGAAWLRIGPVGISVHTAQTRLFLETATAGSGLTAGVHVHLPLYLELAPADARLDRIQCGASKSDLRVTVAARSGVVDSWIGAVTPELMTNVTRPVEPGPAEFVRLPLASVSGRAHAAIRSTDYQSLDFRIEDIERDRAKTVRTQTPVTSLVQGLLGDLRLQANVAGLGLGLPVGGLTGNVGGMLAGIAVPVDNAVATLLGGLGIGLGEADVWIAHARCDGAVLVQ